MTDKKNKYSLISIIIPVYNVEPYLTQCLRSLLDQSLTDWQAICINDGSTDNSLQVLQRFAAKDKRFLIINQSNQGVSAARNAGLKVATAKYIMFLDSDDILHPQCLEIAYNTIEATGTDICDFKMKMIEENEVIIYPTYSTVPIYTIVREPLQKMINRQIDRSILSFAKKIYRSDIAKQGVFPNIEIGEDILYSWQVLMKVKKCSMLNNVFYYYVQHSSSASHKRDNIRHYIDHLIMDREFCKLYPEIGRKYQSYPDTLHNLQQYLCRRLFSNYIVRAYRLNLPKNEIEQAFNSFKDCMEEYKIKAKLLKFRHRIMLYLLKMRYYCLAGLFR